MCGAAPPPARTDCLALQGLGGAGAAAMLQKTTEVRMKPHRNLMELDLALDTNCSNYDPENQLASATR